MIILENTIPLPKTFRSISIRASELLDHYSGGHHTFSQDNQEPEYESEQRPIEHLRMAPLISYHFCLTSPRRDLEFAAPRKSLGAGAAVWKFI